MADPNRTQTTKPTTMELSSTPPKHPLNGLSALPPTQFRALSTSTSFDSKSSIPNFCTRFQMSAEASKLFHTLQQSPLPLNSEVSHYNFSEREFIVFVVVYTMLLFVFQIQAMDTTTKFIANQNAHGVPNQELNMLNSVQGNEKSPMHRFVSLFNTSLLASNHYVIQYFI